MSTAGAAERLNNVLKYEWLEAVSIIGPLGGLYLWLTGADWVLGMISLLALMVTLSHRNVRKERDELLSRLGE